MLKTLNYFFLFLSLKFKVPQYSDCDDGVLLYLNLESLKKRRSYFHYVFFEKIIKQFYKLLLLFIVTVTFSN